jgi:glutamine synthetase
MKVYQAINSVQAELCKIGIAKDSRNTQGQGYNFRGIDAVYNVLSSIMAQNGLVIVPRMLARTCEERISKSGGALFYVTVEAEFDLISAEDGSKHTARTFGEAMDSGDKATNKAMSAAYKYMAFQTFAIPTSGDNDADSSTHEVVRKKPTIDNNRLGQAIQKIKEGAYTTDKLRETFALTAEQEKVLVGALSE